MARKEYERRRECPNLMAYVSFASRERQNPRKGSVRTASLGPRFEFDYKVEFESLDNEDMYVDSICKRQR
jgi:hypothetical protein